MARLGRSQPTNVIYSDNIYSLPIATTGTGSAAATGTGQLFVSLEGHGDTTASGTAPLLLAARVDGTGATTSGGTGLLIESARLTGNGANAAGARAPLEIVGGHVDEAGQGTASAGGTATLLFALDLAGHGDTASTGTVPLVVGPPVLGFVAWYDASDLTTITSVANAVSAWADKSGNGYNLTQPTGFKQPSTGLRTICHHNVISFNDLSGKGLTGSGLALHDSVITVFVVAQYESGNRMLSFTDGVQSDWDNTAGLSVLDFNDDGSFYDNGQVTGAGAGFSDGKAFVYDLRRDGGVWSANRDGVPFPGAITVDTNFNILDIGVGGIPFPPDLAASAAGLVGEILVYAEALDPGEITAIELYLNTKWLVRGATLLDGHGDAADGAALDLTIRPQNIVTIDGHGDASDGTNTSPLVLAADLSGHGDVSPSSNVDLRVLGFVSLNGHGDASSGGQGARPVIGAALTGHGDSTSGGTGRQDIGLAGHGDTSSAAAALLQATLVLAAHGDAAAVVTNLVRITAALTGQGAVAVSGNAFLFGAVQDPDAAMLTILDDHHTDTIWDRGHTVTLIDG